MMNEDSLVDGDYAWENAPWDDWDCHLKDLGTIVTIYNETQKCCRHLLADELSSTWEPVSSFDHRTLYMVRRILFSVWHHRSFPNQANLPLELTPQMNLADARWGWHHWLRSEIQSWIWSPSLLQKVTQILRHPNTLHSYIAENGLTLQLMARFDDIPWKQSFVDGIQNELERDIDKLE
jgi:hypothetical protein